MPSKWKLRSFCVASLLSSFMVLCGCVGLSKSTTQSNANLNSINHIIFMAQENRSFDSYFSQLPAYWSANGYTSQSVDVAPSGSSNPGFGGAPNVTAFHLTTDCIENLSPSWNESHLDWNLNDPTSSTSEMNGFVWNAANYAQNQNASGAQPPFVDIQGYRAMGYYDATDLPYYYFMVTNFATSDRWFAPAMDRTQINRMYLMAGTSHGYAYPPGTNAADQFAVDVPTIFDALSNASITWKIYATDNTCTSSGGESGGGGGFCTYLTQFKKYASSPLPSNVVAASEFLNDAAAGTLPAVSFIEPGYLSGQDEHPSSGTDVKTGAAYVASLINGLMNSPSWKDSVFILTYDEAGGTYDHVPPQPMPNPDDISPVDLTSADTCFNDYSNPLCNFQYTGYRVPVLVVSPFTKKNYISHTVMDYTAILKLIETRFNLQPLTKRDAAQPDMTEFFDFQNVPWATPPINIPSQPSSGTCNAANLGYSQPE